MVFGGGQFEMPEIFGSNAIPEVDPQLEMAYMACCRASWAFSISMVVETNFVQCGVIGICAQVYTWRENVLAVVYVQ